MQSVEALCQAALALETEAQRTDYLNVACPDPAVRREVEDRLARQQNPRRLGVGDTIRIEPVDDRSSNPRRHYLGKTLDEKYRLDRLLGEGGMGEVYLSTHLGTGRYVAVKLIIPQFMANQEFVERFKREARAAGRLRHPNIVDVTDFGAARVDSQNVAYLVMEYLDGCTLSDVLAEESRLPLHWVLDILEQACLAVHEAHRRGIVHRDLKPANIWLEPNTLGGYRVKVLDFGIAKLAGVQEGGHPAHPPEAATQIVRLKPGEPVEPRAGAGGSGRLAEPPLAAPAAALTQAGVIMGTPMYMSPEQCRGEGLDARSDIYSLGVIAYQMLAGTTPFTGEPGAVLRAQELSPPEPLRVRNPGVPPAVARVIMSALEKNPAARPQTAVVFAQALRANAEGLGALYRRAFALYSEYFPKVITLSLLAHIPVIFVLLLMVGLRVADPWLGQGGQMALGSLIWLSKGAASFLTASAISGVIAIIVTQLTVVPLKPVSLRAAFDILLRRWRPLLKTGFRVTLRILFGFMLCIVPGLVMMVRYALWAPVVLLEGAESKAAFRRSRVLVARSPRTVVLAALFQALVPVVVQWMITRLAGLGAVEKAGVRQNVVTELITLSSVFVLPLVSIVMALVYLKMRQLGGEEMGQVMTHIEEPGTRPNWERRMYARVDPRA